MMDLEFKDGLDEVIIEDYGSYVRIELRCGGGTRVVQRLGSDYAWRRTLWLLRWKVRHRLRRLRKKIFSPSNL